MDIEYNITVDDLVQMNLALAERVTGMSLWIRHLAGICLGPVGGLIFVSAISDWHHMKESQGTVGLIIALGFGLLFIWGVFSSILYSGWFLRWQMKHRTQQNPRLLGRRSLYGSDKCLIEMTHNGMYGFLEAADKPAFVQENAFQCLEWKHLQQIKERRSHIILIATSGSAIIIPIAGESPAKVQTFREAVMAHWESAKTGKPLPSQEGVWPPPPQLGA